MNKEEKQIFYTISEMSRIIGVPQHILRNWEKEIGFFKPKKKETGHRVYTKRDLEIAKRIKELIEIENYTIIGARKRLWYELKRNEAPSPFTVLHRVKKELQDLLDTIKSAKEKI